ncbi:MAG: YebC/PmpR family DNA-binding transcriptional regulator [Planctomycetes bacterium]|nr:YebC/PmpR family DNA-binding transcriptional regulator [Planctomycetota bacterium]
MSGHSHWARIRHKKGATDAKRGKLFSKLVKNIMVAARLGGGDLAANLRLQYAIDAAKAANVPKDTIERAVKKGTGEIAGESYEEVTYEGYGPGGAALLVEATTNNRNRTASDIRKVFESKGGSLSRPNTVAWMFEVKGVIVVDAAKADEETVMEIVLDAGADDMEDDGDMFTITCTPQNFESVRQALEAKEIPVESAEISKVAQTYIDIATEHARRVLNLMAALEDYEDVQNIYSNFNIPDEVLAEIEAEGE